MISILLAEKIAELFLVLLAGFVVVKVGLLSSREARALSLITLYLICPCPLITACEVDLTPELAGNLALVYVMALVGNFLMYGMGTLFAHVTGASVTERASVTYSNSGNLIIPVVTSVLGPSYVVYATGYMSIQTVMFWTLLKKMYTGEARVSVREVLTNVNIIALFVGLFLMFTGLRLPPLVDAAVASLGDMIGPASMLIVGMTLADMDFHTLFERRRVWLVVLAKMIVIPFTIIGAFKLLGLGSLFGANERVLLMPMLAIMAPTATTVTQFAQMYQQEPEYASAINVLTTLSCIITMPLMVQFFLM